MHGPVKRFCFDYHIFTTNSSPVTKYSKNDRIVNTHGGGGVGEKDKKSHSLFKDYFQTESKPKFPKKDTNHKLFVQLQESQ